MRRLRPHAARHGADAQRDALRVEQLRGVGRAGRARDAGGQERVDDRLLLLVDGYLAAGVVWVALVGVLGWA